jgi:hypothetical protein
LVEPDEYVGDEMQLCPRIRREQRPELWVSWVREIVQNDVSLPSSGRRDDLSEQGKEVVARIATLRRNP